MKNKKRNLDDSFIFTNPDYTLFKEAYVRLKDSLYFCSNGGEKKVIQIESSIPNEAKTLTAINLACAIAADNKKVLLVDLDLHKGVMHRTFEIDNVNGITDLVKNGFKEDNLFKKTKIDNLYLLNQGEKLIQSNSAVILSSLALKDALNKAREEFDYIILDCPPVLSSTDYLHISALSDGVLFVVAQTLVKKKQVKEAAKMLKKNSISLIGFVVTKAENVDKANYYYYY